MQIVFDADKVTLDELAQFERGITYGWLIDFFAKFVQTDDGKDVTIEDGRRFIGQLSTPDGLAVKSAFRAFMGGVKQSAVPPESLAR